MSSVADRRRRSEDVEETLQTGLRWELREALRAEIAAARSASAANAITLKRGRRLLQGAGLFHYAFQLDFPQRLSADAPAEFVVPGYEPVMASVHEVQLLTVTLVVPTDFGPTIPYASLRADLTFLLQKLIDRLEETAERRNPVGDRLVGLAPKAAGAWEGPLVGDYGLLQEQELAFRQALGGDVFIWGPPGTGKTRTIGAIAAELLEQGRSVLLVSHTNTAVNQGLLRVIENLERQKGVPAFAEGELVRVGAVPDARLQDGAAEGRPSVLARSIAHRRSGTSRSRRFGALDLNEFLADAEPEVAAYRDELAALMELQAALLGSADELEKARARLVECERLAEVVDLESERLADVVDVLRAAEAKVAAATGRTALAGDVVAKRDRERVEVDEALNAARTGTGRLARRWRRLPDPEEQAVVVRDAESALEEASARLADAQRELAKAEAREAGARATAEAVRARLDRRARDRVRAERGRALNAVEQLVSQIEDGRAELRRRRGALSAGRVHERVVVLAAKAEALVVREARLVATTLTRAYLLDVIAERRFDVVILDDASMAPVPALFFAAGLSEQSAVVVGDFRQLPPIVLADKEKAPLAFKWLGRDIFEVNHALEHEHSAAPPEWFVLLREQRRMQPAVSAVVNDLVYSRKLRDGELHEQQEQWLAEDWPYAADRVLLLDLSETGAWVSLAPSGRHASRLNFYSATASVDLAAALLAKDRAEFDPSSNARIAIVSPYSPHAALCNLLLEARNLHPEVQAGTAHAFQGYEADTVILDLVNAPPVGRAGMFMPDESENGHYKRLLNVAISRAKQRLVVIGHFQWLVKHANRNSFVAALLDYLCQRYPQLPIEKVIPSALHERVAAAQRMIDGERTDSTAHVLADEIAYYELLRKDLRSAQSEVVIFSPFLTERRCLDLQSSLRACIDRRVRVAVVSKPATERKEAASRHRACEVLLREWGVTVIHKKEAHEKLVLVDRQTSHPLCWHGSLNTLSERESGELMTREADPSVVRRYDDVMCVDDLLRPFFADEPSDCVCPVCGEHPLMAVSNYQKPPFIWRCEDADHYWREREQPAPIDGRLRCKCGADLRFGYWGDKPHWLCTQERHRQRVHRNHLRLPKMRALIPKDALRELLRDFQLDGAALPGPANGQPTLCESSTGPSPPEQFGECPLTAREVEFLNAAGQGLTTRELAKKLGLAPTTVTNMVSAVNHKLGTRDRLEAAATAAAAGWVDAPSVAAPDRPTARPVARHRSDPRREEKSNGQAAIDHDPRAETTKSPGENGGVTDREREILRGLATHRTKQQLAAQLGMEPPALRGELRALFRKLNVPDRHAAVRRARDQGLL